MRMPLSTIPLSAILALSASLLMAQSDAPQHGSPPGRTQPSAVTTPATETGPSGQPNPTSQASSPTARQMSDQTFVREASAAGLSEVADAQAALQSAKRLDVRKAAQQLLTDHTAANEKLRSLAQRKNIALAGGPAAKPAVPSAADFDTAYVAAQIKAHQIAIALFEAEATGGTDNDLREFASSMVPTLRQHLAMMQGLQ